MTSTEAERYTTKIRTGRERPAGSGRRRIYVDNPEERASAINTVTGTAGRYRSTGDRSDRVDRNEKTETSSVTSRISKLNTNDDKKEDEGATNDNNDVEDSEEQPTRNTRKKAAGGASSSSANKRKARKNLREKRRSTGVVIMPGQPVKVLYCILISLTTYC